MIGAGADEKQLLGEAEEMLDEVLGRIRAEMERVIADSGFSKRVREFARRCGLKVTITKKAAEGFKLQPRRWVVERTFAWLTRYRRLRSDYECLPETSEAMIRAAMIHLMLRRLHPTDWFAHTL